MSYPIFDFDFQNCYSASVEFKTQINEKQLGNEQRYPVWTYPKRTFTLKFDKNFSQRKKLEDFYIQVVGSTGYFYFVWDENKGGNGKKYLCSFDDDSLQQNVFDFGFSEFQLNLITVDDYPVETSDSFDFWHSAELDFSIKYKTISDETFSAKFEKKILLEFP